MRAIVSASSNQEQTLTDAGGKERQVKVVIRGKSAQDGRRLSDLKWLVCACRPCHTCLGDGDSRTPFTSSGAGTKMAGRLRKVHSIKKKWKMSNFRLISSLWGCCWD